MLSIVTTTPTLPPMNLPLRVTLGTFLVTAATSCVAPSNLAYQPRMTDEQLAASQARIQNVEDRAYYERDRERMSDARATEMATRHNPTSVTTHSTSLWFW